MKSVMTAAGHLPRGVWVLGMLLVVGCGGSISKSPRVPVTGKILLEGAPVDGAVVAFSSEDGKATAVAMTDELGAFQLNVPPGKQGVPPGKYRVTVRKSTVANAVKEPTSFAEMEREHQAGRTPEPPPVPKLAVPARYGDPTSSQLAEEVTLSGKNNFVFDLKG